MNQTKEKGLSNEGPAQLGHKEEIDKQGYQSDQLSDINLQRILSKQKEMVVGVATLADSGNENETLSDEEAAMKETQTVAQEIDEADTRCGLGSFHPAWLQWFASKKTYVALYGIIGMMDNTTGSHLISSISTLEKRFKISSRTSGIIACGWDIGGLLCNLTLSYIGGRGHKTRYVSVCWCCVCCYCVACGWDIGGLLCNLTLSYIGGRGHKTRYVSAGVLLISLSCFMLYMMHVVYGPGQDALRLTLEYGASFNTSYRLEDGVGAAGLQLCGKEHEVVEDCTDNTDTSILPSIILILSQVIPGAGLSMYYTLGFAYLDDNCKKDKTPFLLAVMQFIKFLGPTVGFILGSYGLSLYVDPSLHPVITPEDPRWIGAWWFGWIPIGITSLFLSVALAMFPKTLPRAAERMQQRGESLKHPPNVVSFSDFKQVMQRLFKNKVLMFNSLSSVCFTFGLVGFWAFTPKYMETVFQQTASDSSFITGAVGLTSSALGIISSGAVISWFKPRPRYLAMWNVIAEFLECLGYLSFGFITCGNDDSFQRKPGFDNSWNLTASCNEDCFCGPTVNYSPVCSLEGNKTFFSPCHAGCTTVDLLNGTKMFGNCSCIGDGTGWALDGECMVDCGNSFVLFIAIQSILRFLSASGRAGNMIISFRCVNQDDKSVSMGFTFMLMCVFALIPGPIFYGILLDMACTVWGEVCGTTGNCWLYDIQYLRFLMNFTSSAFLLGGTFFDVGVWYHVKGLQMYEDP